MTNADCCCYWGSALKDSYPEFPCADCPRHSDEQNDRSRRCRRHTKELIGVRYEVVQFGGTVDVTLARCYRCSALVEMEKTEAHDTFHSDVDRIASLARAKHSLTN